MMKRLRLNRPFCLSVPLRFSRFAFSLFVLALASLPIAAAAQTPALVWYITTSSTTSQTGVYTVHVDGDATATNPTDVSSTPSAPFVQLEAFAINPSAGHYFVTNLALGGTYGNTSEIIEGNTNGSGTPSVVYTSGNSGGTPSSAWPSTSRRACSILR